MDDEVSAYLYYDYDHVLKASSKEILKIGQIYDFKATNIDKYGIYFEIKDKNHIMMPFDEKTYKVIMEMTYPVVVKESNDGLIYLSSKIRDYLDNNHNFNENDEVSGRIYSINKSIGAFVAIDNKYDSLLRMNELKGVTIEGELVKARVKEVKHDGKIELSLRARAHIQINSDSDIILDYLYDNDGVLYLSDRSSPDKIYNYFKMSKAAYKRAIGRLYKNSDIIIYKDRIELKEGKNDRK